MKGKSKFLLSMASVAGICLAPCSLLALEIAPATAQDILSALGPDARGLILPQEALPDLFTLTANRIDEDPAKFIVQEPYVSGHWKGGKAVIEFARDLSYTVVSIYDKQGIRQRIYSVRTTFSEHVQTMNKRASAPVPVPEAVPSETRPPPQPVIPPQASPVSYTSVGKVPAPKGVEPKPSYEWDETKGAYVPLAVSATVTETAAMTETETRKPVAAHPESAGTPPAAPQARVVVANAPAKTAPPADDFEEVWVRVTPRPSQSTAAKVKVDSTTWVERTEEAPKPEYRLVKRHRRHPKVKPPAEAPAVASAPSTPSAEPTAKPPPPVVAMAKTQEVQETPLHPSPVSGGAVPSEEELLAIKSVVSKEPPVPAPSAVAPVQTSSTPPAPPVPSVSAPPVPAASAASAPNQAGVPGTEELLASNQKPSGPDTSEGDTWVPKAAPKPVVSEPVEPPTPQEPMKVAMAPEPVTPVDNSVENLLKIANERVPAAPRESDAWVPQKTSMTKPEVDIDREVARIRARESQEAAAKRNTVGIKRDINNPEEGVLPVSSFEKFSGPMYGRHREYERRFVPGKKKRAKVPDHDFYVDEVDRKKEIHNVYYYMHQKGKGPKLVAVERHEKVSFLGNYDIEKEDKGKLSTYN